MMNSTVKRTCAIALLILIFVLLAFIWSNSLMDKRQSHLQSLAFLQFISSLFGSISKSGLTEAVLRKIAHFLEFFSLSVVITSIFRLFRPTSLQLIFNTLSLGLIAAVIDESLQIISARGAMISDVLLDFCGVIAGTVFALAAAFICGRISSLRLFEKRRPKNF